MLSLIIFVGCSKVEQDEVKDKKTDKTVDTVNIEEKDLKEYINSVVGKYESFNAPAMKLGKNYIWYFYENGTFAIMKKDCFNKDNIIEPGDVKCGKYEFYEKNAFKVTFYDGFNSDKIVFVIKKDKEISILGLSDNLEVKLKNVEDKNFDDKISKFSLPEGKYQLFIGKEKGYGTYWEVEGEDIGIYQNYNLTEKGKYFLFDDVVLIYGKKNFYYNKIKDGYKLLQIPSNKEGTLKFVE